MHSVPSLLLERITIDPDVRVGKPCIRGHRITVQELLEWPSSGASQRQILADYPQLEPDDFLAVYANPSVCLKRQSDLICFVCLPDFASLV